MANCNIAEREKREYKKEMYLPFVVVGAGKDETQIEEMRRQIDELAPVNPLILQFGEKKRFDEPKMFNIDEMRVFERDALVVSDIAKCLQTQTAGDNRWG